MSLEMKAKVIKCGDVVEVSFYSVPISCGPRDYQVFKRDDVDFDHYEKRFDNLVRARQKVRQIIWCNQTIYTKFVTLTYAKTVLDVSVVRNDIHTFVKNMRRKGYDMKYLYVLENQKGRGQKEGNLGCLHVHMLIFVDKYIPYEILNKCWNKGQTDIKIIDDIKNLGAYVSKYITKDNLNEFHSRTFACSKGLKRPEEERFYTIGFSDNGLDISMDDLLNSLDISYSSSLRHDYINSFDGSSGTQTIKYYQGKLKEGYFLGGVDPLYEFKRKIEGLHLSQDE